MTFSAYIQRQKSLIRSHRGDRPEERRDVILPEYNTEMLLDELNSLRGLNTAERQHYSKIFTHA